MLASLPLIRRRIRGKIRASGVLDEDDILASVWRRVDQAAAEGRLRARVEAEFWGFVHRVTDHLISNKVRDERLRPMRLSDAGRDADALAGTELDRPSETFPEVLRSMMRSLPAESDRELLYWRLNGAPYSMIAGVTGRSEDALRAAWSRIRKRLQDRNAP